MKRKLSEVKLSELPVVGWYQNGRAFLASWDGETTRIEVVGDVSVPVHGLIRQVDRQRLDGLVTLKVLHGPIGAKLVVIALGEFED